MIIFALTLAMQSQSGPKINIDQTLHKKYWIEATKVDLPALEKGFKSLVQVDAPTLRVLIESYLMSTKPMPKNPTDPAFIEGMIEYRRKALNIGVLNRLKFHAVAKKYKLKNQLFGPAPELNNHKVWKQVKGSWKLQPSEVVLGDGLPPFDVLKEFDWLVKKSKL